MKNKGRLRSNVRINELINLNKDLSDRFKIVDNMYEHTISSIQDFEDTINLLQDELSKNVNYAKLFYRGMEEEKGETWDILPSLAFNKMVKYENELIMSFLHKKPSDFANMEDNFEMIAKMQHFGLPTRILDFSLNPYIALYFATENNKDNYGKVIIHLNKLDTLDSNYTKQIFFSYYNITAKDYDYCQEIIDQNKIDYVMDYDYVFLDKLLDFDKKNFVKYLFNNYYHYNCITMCSPKYYTERERNQQSVFMIFANELYDFQQKHILKSDNIEEIINTEKDCSQVDNINNRFIPMPKIKALTEEQLTHDFLIIKIPQKLKVTIKKYLNNIGIKNSFIYTELNYVAKDIIKEVKEIRDREEKKCNKIE